MTHPEVVVADRGAARLRRGHPWVYRSDVLGTVDGASDAPRPGFGRVVDRRGGVLGWAAVNGRSEITVRLVHAHDEPVDEAALLRAVDRAIDHRTELVRRGALDAREREALAGDVLRLVHGDADGLPGLVVDRYGPVVVMQSGAAAFEPHLAAIAEHLRGRTGAAGVLGRLDAAVRRLEGLSREVRPLAGSVPERLEVRIGGAVVEIDPWRGQKTGAFLDQRVNAQRLAAFARGRVLDVFSYAGGFALQLANGRPDGTPPLELELVDASRSALDLARAALERNGVQGARLTAADAFARLRELESAGARFDLVNLDPPALAKRRRDRDAAYGAYKELNLRALRLLGEGGVLGTSSCSFHVSEEDFVVMLEDAAADAGRVCRVLARHGAAPDHPERLGFPESRYLTFVVAQVVDVVPRLAAAGARPVPRRA